MHKPTRVQQWLVRRWWLILLALAVVAYLTYFGYILPNEIFNGFD